MRTSTAELLLLLLLPLSCNSSVFNKPTTIKAKPRIQSSQHVQSAGLQLLTPNTRTLPSVGPRIPTVGPRARDLHYSIRDFLSAHPLLELGGQEHFTVERRRHQEVFGLHALPKDKIHPIDDVEFTAIRGPHGTIPIRVLYPASGKDSRNKGRAGALIYFHGGGYTVGSVDEFENGLRLVAEESGCQVYVVEYRLAPEFKYPVQLDEYSAVIDWVQGEGGRTRGVHPDKVLGGGDSAGGNMTAAICLRRMDEGRKPLAGQVLLYPEARLPFDTPAATENNSSLYLECNGIFSFASNYLPRSEGMWLSVSSSTTHLTSLFWQTYHPKTATSPPECNPSKTSVVNRPLPCSPPATTPCETSAANTQTSCQRLEYRLAGATTTISPMAGFR